MKRHLEIYLARFYVRTLFGETFFWITLIEIQNHSSGKSWAMIQFGKSDTGFEIGFGRVV